MASVAIAPVETPLCRALLGRADDALILGHRLSEWTGRAPLLEEELALANIALDLIGQARALYAQAGALCGHDEDALAYLRDAPHWRNALLVEQPNGDFAQTIVRQVLFVAAMLPWWREAARGADAGLTEIALRAGRECAYHWRHAETWLERLGRGTAESHARCTRALAALWPYRGEILAETPEETALIAEGTWPDPTAARAEAEALLRAALARAGLDVPADDFAQQGGRAGRHSEHLGLILAVMQHLPRSHPGAAW